MAHTPSATNTGESLQTVSTSEEPGITNSTQNPPATEQDPVNGEEQEDGGVGTTRPYEVESLCMNCHENGMTKLLLLKIPHFREVILESFDCPHCGLRNSSVKSGDQIQEKGSKFVLHLFAPNDLQRQIVKSDSAVFKLETLGIEMPTGKGQITNVEGILTQILNDMQDGQDDRKVNQPDLYALIQPVIEKLIKMSAGECFPFKISLDDPAGLSWISPLPGDNLQKYSRTEYFRDREQNEALGIVARIAETEEESAPAASQAEEIDPMADVDILAGKNYQLPSECPACSKPCFVQMQMVDIPHFQEVLVMATVCDHCGYKSNEVKTGGSIPEKGQRIILKVKDKVDLARDVLKSQTCGILVPEIDLFVAPGTMGGRFTTLEGILTQTREDLHGKIYGTGDEDLKPGDALGGQERTAWEGFFKNLDRAIEASIEYTVIIEDPLANSYVQSLGDANGEGEDDPQLTVEDYTRSEEEEEELGLKDMQTEGYEGDPNLETIPEEKEGNNEDQ